MRKFFFFIFFLSALHASEPRYILRSPDYNPGLFSLFSTVIGFLDFYEEKQCAIEVDLGKKGVYYEKKKGPNWWTYYFEPIAFGNKTDKIVEISDEQQSSFANKTLERMSREEVHRLIKKYIVLKKPIKKKIDAFAKKHFTDQFVIGIHYRGTDKISEAPRVAYERVFEEIEKVAKGKSKYKLFVATDEQAFLDAILVRFSGKVVYLDSIRSSNGKAIHSSKKNAYQKGEEAILDCLLLSKTNFLIRTESNLGACSTFFNPTIPVIVMNKNSFF
jgi:hypothetical protein